MSGNLQKACLAISKPKICDRAGIDMEYENNKYLIECELSKTRPKISKLKDLMDETFEKRRSWIKETCPSATEVLLKYPCLLNVKIVNSFETIFSRLQIT